MFFQLIDIGFAFLGSDYLFNNVTLNLDEKKIYALTGGNGSGKTTLLNLISGFHKPQRGTINFKGQDITSLLPYMINRIGIGRTFQDLRLISKLTVKENLLLAMRNDPTDSWVKALLPTSLFKKETKKLESQAEKISTEYFLQEVLNAPAREISFGQQKLLNLACCVANDAELLLLDEPAAGISPRNREQMATLLKGLREQGKTILMIEHNLDFIKETADRLLFLANGDISKFEDLAELKASKVTSNGYF